MRNPVGHICLFLASSGFSDADIRSFFRWIETRGAARATQAVEMLRAYANDVERTVMRTDLSSHGDDFDLIRNDIEIVNKIERLLIDEARLTKARAIDLLTQELSREIPEKPLAPPANRQSFRSWVARVSHQVPPGLLLHIATRIRNEAVHAPKTDWPLRKE